jgi:hypothetical protein
VARLADEKAVGGQDSAVGVGDGEVKFAGAVLRASERGEEQEKKGGVDRKTAQMDSPRSAGMPRGYFTVITGGGGGAGALLLSGESACCSYYEQAARMLSSDPEIPKW